MNKIASYFVHSVSCVVHETFDNGNWKFILMMMLTWASFYWLPLPEVVVGSPVTAVSKSTSAIVVIDELYVILWTIKALSLCITVAFWYYQYHYLRHCGPKYHEGVIIASRLFSGFLFGYVTINGVFSDLKGSWILPTMALFIKLKKANVFAKFVFCGGMQPQHLDKSIESVFSMGKLFFLDSFMTSIAFSVGTVLQLQRPETPIIQGCIAFALNFVVAMMSYLAVLSFVDDVCIRISDYVTVSRGGESQINKIYGDRKIGPMTRRSKLICLVTATAFYMLSSKVDRLNGTKTQQNNTLGIQVETDNTFNGTVENDYSFFYALVTHLYLAEVFDFIVTFVCSLAASLWFWYYEEWDKKEEPVQKIPYPVYTFSHNFKRDVQMVSSMHRFYRPDFLTDDAPSEKIAETKTADNATKTRTLDECLSLYKNQM